MTALEEIAKVIEQIGYSLESEQPHLSGERFLMSKDKYVLVARRSTDNAKVIIKTSRSTEGKVDINNEKRARDLLKSISFANKKILLPNETYYGEIAGYTLWATEYIEQDKIFVAHTTEEQFFLILSAFEEQESFHATTYEHLNTVKQIFPILQGQEYFREFDKFMQTLTEVRLGTNLAETLIKAASFLRDNKNTIDKHSNYLTHTDFVPHNFRVKDRQIYMLDCSPEYRTVHFGNKYEGWARFLNYMTIHNPELEKTLSDYVRKNRGEEEYLNLRLMRVYKLGFLLDFYAKSISKTEGDLKELTIERINFWHEVLKFILNDQEIPTDFIENYKNKRDNLRSEEEKKRQREFAVA